MNLGPAEIIVILLVGLLVFGPSRLPELSRQVGGAMRELRKMQSTLKREIDEAMKDDSAPKPRTATRTAMHEAITTVLATSQEITAGSLAILAVQ